MADPAFFEKNGPFSLDDIARKTGCTLLPPAKGAQRIEDVASLEMAGRKDLSFLDNRKYKKSFESTKAGAVIISEKMAEFAPQEAALLISPNPYKSYALAAQMFYPEDFPEAKISEKAHIGKTAKISKGCVIEPFAIIQDDVEIGEGSWIQSGAVIGSGVKIGKNCRIGTNVSLSHSILGDSVRLYPGVRVGQDGFGFAIDLAGHVKVPQLGRVIIEDHVEIGANTTIDRGAGPDTIIGAGTWIDNLVQIGHNAKIGKGCVIVAQSGVSGSTVLEDYVVLGGQVGIAGHLKIGKAARIAAQSGVMRDIPAGEEHMGYPSQPIKQYLRQIALLKRLTNSAKDE